MLKRYNAEGEVTLGDKWKNNGGKRFLDETQQAALEAALSEPPLMGLWTGPKVAAWISETLQRPVSAVSGWNYLKRLGYTLQTPCPRPVGAAMPDAQQTLKKLKERRATLEHQPPEKRVEVWAEDETRLGLLPVHRRICAKAGQRPIAPVCASYKWLVWGLCVRRRVRPIGDL